MPRKRKREYASSKKKKKRFPGGIHIKCAKCDKFNDCLFASNDVAIKLEYVCEKCSRGNVCPDFIFDVDLFWKIPEIKWLQNECASMPNDIWQIILNYYSPPCSREVIKLSDFDEAGDFLDKIARCWKIRVPIKGKIFACDRTFRTKFLTWALYNVRSTSYFIFPRTSTAHLTNQLLDGESAMKYFADKLALAQKSVEQRKKELSSLAGFERWQQH